MSDMYDELIETEDAEKTVVEDKTPSLLKEFLNWLEILIVAFLISLFLTKVVLINATVPSASMEDLIEPGDRLFGLRVAYAFTDPKRFDVVIFRYPVDETQNYIKRIIGLPGEHVLIQNGEIYINGSKTPLTENYLPEEWVIESRYFSFEVPEDSYLCLGDNRNISQDARFWAGLALKEGVASNEEEAEQYTYVKREQILGKALFTYWPQFQILFGYQE